jgi:uncharacterized protein
MAPFVKRGPLWQLVTVAAIIILTIFGIRFHSRMAISHGAVFRIPEVDYVASVEVARTPLERQQGLSGRPSLDRDSGMLILFDFLDQHRIWMKEMRFSIDLIWIAGGVVIDTHKDLPVPTPGVTMLPTFNPRPQALMVLEVPAGIVDEFGIIPGNRVEITFDE